MSFIIWYLVGYIAAFVLIYLGNKYNFLNEQDYEATLLYGLGFSFSSWLGVFLGLFVILHYRNKGIIENISDKFLKLYIYLNNLYQSKENKWHLEKIL